MKLLIKHLTFKCIPLLLFLMFFPQMFFGQSFSGQRPTGQTEAFPRLEPDPKALEFFSRGTGNTGYSWTDLAEISLWASGANTDPYLGQIRAAAQAIVAAPDFPAGERDRAAFILDYMHKNLLRSYSLTQSEINTLLSTGRFNCVSSAVLYMVLCKSVGLEVSGVITREHAFAIVRIGGENIDVETTNRYGFDPGNRMEFHDAFGRLTGFTYVPAQNYRDRQTITPIELISIIFSNRITELERRNRFSEAIPLALDRAALLSGAAFASPGNETSAYILEPSRQYLLDRLFNYGALLLNSGRDEDCLRWIASAALLYPDENHWNELTLAAINNRIARLFMSGQLSDARNFLDAHGSSLNQADYAQLDSMIVDAQLLKSANGIQSATDGDNVAAAIYEARANGRIGRERASELLNYAIQKTAAILSADRDWLAAINYIENAITRFGSNRELEQALQNNRNNRATEYHNRFATAWNRRNFDEARRILDEGLAEFPNDRQLLANREIINRN